MQGQSSPGRSPNTAVTENSMRTASTSGVAGNAALTRLASLALLCLLALEGMTVLKVRLLFTPHVFLGLLLIPPILLKMASVGYRFTRYYTGDGNYRAIGPPKLLPRVLGPFVVIATVCLFGSGVVLLLDGPSGGEVWRRFHTAAFVLWFGLMSIHVLIHLPAMTRLTRPELPWNRSGDAEAGRPGRLVRRSLVAGSVLLGLALAVGALPLDTAWSQWLAHLGPDQ